MKSPKSSTFSWRRLGQTPTFAFTATGVLCVVLWKALNVPYADLAAFIFFVLPGMGTAMAMGAEVARKGYTWGWKGVLGAIFRKPSKFFLFGFFGHLLQLAAALAIALLWRRKSQK